MGGNSVEVLVVDVEGSVGGSEGSAGVVVGSTEGKLGKKVR